MTAQVSDHLRFGRDGERRPLFTNPLQNFLQREGIGPRIDGMGFLSTANYRGYVATFVLHDGRLWLEHLATDGRSVLVAKQRQRWVPTADGRGQEKEVEAKASFEARAAVVDPQRRPFTVEGLFPPEMEGVMRDDDGRVLADWYSGELRVPLGDMVQYVHAGYVSQYERDRLIMIQSGSVVREWTRENV